LKRARKKMKSERIIKRNTEGRKREREREREREGGGKGKGEKQ
jgi:hypothetical protein